MIVVDAATTDPSMVVASRQFIVVMARGQTSGAAAASLLLSDFAVMAPSATIRVDAPEAWAGVVWRMGRDALRMLAGRRTVLNASDAHGHGLIDEVAEDAQSLFASRSELALDAAAMLIGRRGGDTLERAEFARLFAIGEPQRGLAAFLGKRRPPF